MKTAKRATSPVRRSETVRAQSATADLPTAMALKLWVVLARASAAVGEVAKGDVERHGLTLAEFAILEALHHKGPLLLGEVQKRVLVSSGGITFLVDRLAKRGLVERLACPSDRRARYAALTKRGTKLMREIFPAHAAAICKAVAGLGRNEQRELTALLKLLGKEAVRVAARPPASGKAPAVTPA
jgi:MarR family 2-MHQ and catechol resistance regulon transcriptional repressor